MNEHYGRRRLLPTSTRSQSAKKTFPQSRRRGVPAQRAVPRRRGASQHFQSRKFPRARTSPPQARPSIYPPRKRSHPPSQSKTISISQKQWRTILSNSPLSSPRDTTTDGTRTRSELLQAFEAYLGRGRSRCSISPGMSAGSIFKYKVAFYNGVNEQMAALRANGYYVYRLEDIFPGITDISPYFATYRLTGVEHYLSPIIRQVESVVSSSQGSSTYSTDEGIQLASRVVTIFDESGGKAVSDTQAWNTAINIQGAQTHSLYKPIRRFIRPYWKQYMNADVGSGFTPSRGWVSTDGGMNTPWHGMTLMVPGTGTDTSHYQRKQSWEHRFTFWLEFKGFYGFPIFT